ncbi:L-lactate dehydrogenase [Sphingomonas colocasiae]|uniref:L-lactate dehydrogenase n=1 Tax=Sphingomonas colocasiae TaxID=1848973 RepID=A0ABS7PYL5_9SPHN|nr:L-lactate dehydrogenase [Sphingomonas colocasiae]MBY8826408.1 L-lactate dehydrogenase [Sphingomonas colocasiae]
MKMAASASDYRDLARRRLPRFLFEYVDGGSYDEVTMHRNRADLQRVALRQRVLRDVSDVDLGVEIFGRRQAMPVALGPIGLAGLLARRGERQAVAVAEDVGIPFCLSTVSACSLGEVAEAARAPFWFQLYMMRDRGFVQALLAEARDRGCSALVFTVDMPLPGSRYRDYRSGLAGVPGLRGAARRFGQALLRPDWAVDVGLMGRPHSLGNVAPLLDRKSGLDDFMGWMRSNFDPGITWRDLDHIRSVWSGPLVIKGILDVEDARAAAALGADGIVVSNHGGRQLDGVPSAAEALPAIAEAVGGKLRIFADGGVRSGLDVARMLCLGADCVLLGRAWAYALGAGGGPAVRHMLSLFEAELRVALSLTGVTRVIELDRGALAA